jgi:uncharacterized Fe-S cluster protein YjdI
LLNFVRRAPGLKINLLTLNEKNCCHSHGCAQGKSFAR